MSDPSTSTSGSTATSTLWAHLLNKDATASVSGLKAGLSSLGLAATAPADKAGTSVRILLHDTQATIEKFSEKVDRLVSEAEDSRQKLLARNEEVSGEMERLVRRAVIERGVSLLLQICPVALLLSDPGPLGHVLPKLCAYIDQVLDHLSSVGRTETTLQSCIREPAQAAALAELQHSVSSSLDALNQKVEAVQTVRTAITRPHFTRPTVLIHSSPISIQKPYR